MDKIERPIFLDDGSFMDIVRFQDGSHVTTDGFELYFVSDGRYTKLTMTRLQDTLPGLPQSKTNTIFATDDMILFRNIEGQICTLFQDNDITPGQMQMCFNAIMDTRDVNHELNCDGIIHGFPNCSTVMISTNGMLFCRLGNKSKKMIRFA